MRDPLLGLSGRKTESRRLVEREDGFLYRGEGVGLGGEFRERLREAHPYPALLGEVMEHRSDLFLSSPYRRVVLSSLVEAQKREAEGDEDVLARTEDSFSEQDRC